MQRVISIFLILLFTVCTYAQQGINYKALIKDGGGNVIANQMITVQFQILQGAGMTNVYQETHTPTTDANGIIILNIGEVVTPDSGVFADIDWGSDTHFLNTKINTGAGLVDMGTTGFKAVPYALHAKTAESVSGISGTTNFVPKSIDGLALEDSQIFDDGSNIGIGTTTPDYFLDIEGTGGPRARIFSTDGLFAGLLTQNSSRQYFVGIQATSSASDGTNSGFEIFDNTARAQRMLIDADGNMGIGIAVGSAPVAKLDIAGDIKIADGSQGIGKVLTSDADGLASWELPAVINGTTNFLPKFNAGSGIGDSQIFDDGTNVGVGTTSPLSKFHIAANTIGLRQQSSATGASIGFYTQEDAAWFQTHNDFPLLFATNNSETQMILSTNGNLGIGIGAVVPTAKLDVAGDIKITDGTQGAGKILTSDADGLAFWDDSVLNLITALEAQIAALAPQPASIGDIREGGVVFWVDSTGLHGLVCAFSDYATLVEWGCYETDLPNVPNVTGGPAGPGAEIGDGFNNTNNILKDCSNAAAALAARSYGPEWFLPSAKELNEMYVNKAALEAVTGFIAFNTFYSSSTESNRFHAWGQVFANGPQLTALKSDTYYVRAVRAF